VSTASDALQRALERTGFRASLAPEYTAGHAPAAQHREGPPTTEQPPSYFDMPAIKKPDWTWCVPAYFFIGGTASGAYISATVADILNRREDHNHVRAGRLIALLGVGLSVPLLVADLGRPERFLNMLRIFKPRSMMSMGSWALSTFGVFTGLAGGVELLRALSPRWPYLRALAGPLRVLSWLGVLPAMFVGSYTGVLLSATNVPLWAGNRLLMGPLFFSSAMSCGQAATGLAARLFGRLSPSSEQRFERAEQTVLTTELAISAASALMLRGLARPLLTGRWSRVYQAGSLGAGLLLPLLLRRLGLRGGFWGVLSSVLVLIGGVSTRFAVTEAGKESADDPHAYFAYTAPEKQR
jgi:formate-dependent nitrite reductase membrane component NrfD